MAPTYAIARITGKPDCCGLTHDLLGGTPRFLSDLWLPIIVGGVGVFIMSGRYMTPDMGDRERAKTPEGKALLERGSVTFITVRRSGATSMGPVMLQSLVSATGISLLVAYLTWHSLPPAASFTEVFRIAGTATFMSYALGGIFGGL